MCDEELNLADTSAKFAGDSNRRLPAYRILASYFDLIKSEKHGRAGLLYSSKTWICSRSQKCEQAGSGGHVPTNRRGYELVVLLTRATSRRYVFWATKVKGRMTGFRFGWMRIRYLISWSGRKKKSFGRVIDQRIIVNEARTTTADGVVLFFCAIV